MMKCNYNDYNLVSFLSLWGSSGSSWRNFAKIFAVMESMWEQMSPLPRGLFWRKHLFTMDTLSTSSSKRNIWKDEMESYTEKKSKEILEILRFYLDTFITSSISVIQLFSTHWLTTTAKIPIPYQVNFASLYTVLRFYFLSHLDLQIERNG